MLLAACSGGPGSSSGSSGAAAPTASATAPLLRDVASGPAPQIAGAKTGGTLTITDEGAPPTFDPSGAYYEFSMMVLDELLVRSLTGYQNVDGKATLVPDLATDLGEQSADGLTWTFHLKHGIRYSDGSPVRAADVVYAVKRSFAYDSVAEGGPQYVQQYLKGGSTYKGPFDQPTVDFPGVTAQGDDTVVFHLVKKWPTLPYYLAFPEVSPIPQAKDTKATYQNHLLATGPYEIQSFTKGISMVLVRNPDWSAATDPIRHQFPARIEIQLGVNPQTTQQRILADSGTGSTTIDVSGVVASVQNQVTGDKKDQFVSGLSPCESYTSIDTQTVPLAVRKAIAIAYPFDQIRKASGESPLTYRPASTIAPPQVPGVTAYPPVNGLTGHGPGDPAKAKAMLSAAGQLGFSLSYYFIDSQPSSVQANVALKAALTAAGFTVHDLGVSAQQYPTDVTNPSATQNLGQGINSWCYDWPSGDSIYPELFAASRAQTGQSAGDLQSAALDAQMTQIENLPITQAAAAWGKLDQQILSQDLPTIPVDYAIASYVFGDRVHNVVNDANHGLPDLAQLWVG
ncbi:ABC transporter substrate-binding protein [Rudaeicoccus suwonensis]|uniref:Peptide/nickel transport system substrate-binding protein n=1 Tax=Rudaeicoccus suwonensis TaxID=657409 RepID=A0A561EA58_9MICO|nr:ABC transporter substrate-binding protein [Rudaeicoccus suwonensis]TWE12508.1 peptide/nickel transport system substrate-binding protein [Rudaeicoccus suwonensis]